MRNHVVVTLKDETFEFPDAEAYREEDDLVIVTNKQTNIYNWNKVIFYTERDIEG